MESSYSIALSELGDTLAHLVNNAANVIALVNGRNVWYPFRNLPVLSRVSAMIL